MREHECQFVMEQYECVICSPPVFTPDELRRREEDEWLAEQRRLCEIPIPLTKRQQ